MLITARSTESMTPEEGRHKGPVGCQAFGVGRTNDSRFVGVSGPLALLAAKCLVRAGPQIVQDVPYFREAEEMTARWPVIGKSLVVTACLPSVSDSS